MPGNIPDLKNISSIQQLDNFLIGEGTEVKMVIGQHGGRRVQISKDGETITLNLKDLYKKFETLAKDEPKNAPAVNKIANKIRELNSDKDIDKLLDKSQQDRKTVLKLSTSIRQVFGNLFSNLNKSLDEHFPASSTVGTPSGDKTASEGGEGFIGNQEIPAKSPGQGADESTMQERLGRSLYKQELEMEMHSDMAAKPKDALEPTAGEKRDVLQKALSSYMKKDFPDVSIRVHGKFSGASIEVWIPAETLGDDALALDQYVAATLSTIAPEIALDMSRVTTEFKHEYIVVTMPVLSSEVEALDFERLKGASADQMKTLRDDTVAILKDRTSGDPTSGIQLKKGGDNRWIGQKISGMNVGRANYNDDIWYFQDKKAYTEGFGNPAVGVSIAYHTKTGMLLLNGLPIRTEEEAQLVKELVESLNPEVESGNEDNVKFKDFGPVLTESRHKFALQIGIKRKINLIANQLTSGKTIGDESFDKNFTVTRKDPNFTLESKNGSLKIEYKDGHVIVNGYSEKNSAQAEMLYNFLNHIQNKWPLNEITLKLAAAFPLELTDVMKVTDALGVEKQGRLQLPRGDHTIKLLHDKNVKGKKDGWITLKTHGPIYCFPNAKIGGMPISCACLIMKKVDFNQIKDDIHHGAFGGDYQDFGDDQVVVWKLPADLKEIDDWIPSTEVLKCNVGKYGLYDDVAEVGRGVGTKLRMDLPGKGAASVHHLELEDGTLLAGFSTGNLFEDFYDPSKEERGKVDILLQDLEKVGIKAFSCNMSQHLIVLQTKSNGEALTPRDVAVMLQGPSGPDIKQAFKKAAKSDFDEEEWAANFISVYAEKES